jgi:hypothetical protein
MTKILAMSTAAEMHVVGLKTGVTSVSALNRSDVKKGIMITMVLTMTNLIDSALSKGTI